MRIFHIFFLLFLSCSNLFSDQECSSTYTIVEDQNPLKIKTPSLQNVQTEKIILDNGMKVFLISDYQAGESGAALCVNVGFWNDGNFPGIAHFCEHMLFMGSEKYPEENGYSQCIAESDGQRNAFTSPNKTTYTFSVAHTKFEETLDRFSRFFIDPLFKQDAMEREICAVDEEYKKDLESDAWRYRYVQKALGNKKHPNNRFTCGSKETIEKISRDDLIAWYKKHYTSDKMYLCVYSKKNLEELKELVVETFSQVQATKTKTPTIPYAPIFSEKMKGAVLQYQTLSNTRRLILEWEIPKENEQIISAASLIAYSLGHHLEGGLFDTLKKENLIVDLYASPYSHLKDHLYFQISISLTAEGEERIEEIIEHIFSAINTIRTRGIPKYVHEDYAQTLKTGYEWQSRANVFSAVTQIANTLPDEDFSTYPYKFFSLKAYDEKAYHSFLNHLCPSNALFSLWNSFKESEDLLTEKEPWYGALYNLFPLEQETLDKWRNLPPHDNPILPKKNPFTPKDVELFFPNLPPLLQKDEKGICYLYVDNYYFVPKVQLHVAIKCPEMDESARAFALRDLYTQYIQEKTTPLREQGNFSNIYSNIYQGAFKIALYINAYHNQIDSYTKALLKKMRNVDFDHELFSSIKKQSLISMENYDYAMAQKKGIFAFYQMTKNDCFGQNAYKKALEEITVHDLEAFHKNLFEKNFLEVFISGNTSIKKAQALYQEVLDHLSGMPYNTLNHPKSRYIPFYSNSQDENCSPLKIQETTLARGDAMVLVFDQGAYSHTKSAAHTLLGNVLREAYYNELRSQQQTGYIVFAENVCLANQFLQFFVIQSSSYSPEELLKRTYAFIEEFNNNLEMIITKERFLALKQPFEKNKPFKTLETLSNHLNTMIFEKEKTFDDGDDQAKAFDNLEYETFIQISKELLSLDSPEKRVEVFVFGSKE